MLAANDSSQNMDTVHLLDEINSKDSIIADLKYQLEQKTKGNKDTELEIAILKRSNGELNDGIQKQAEILLQKDKEILKLETEGGGQ